MPGEIEVPIVFNIETRGAGKAAGAVSAAKGALGAGGAKAAAGAAEAAAGAAGKAGGILTMIKGMAGSLGAIATSVAGLLGIGAGVVALVMASKTLQKVIERIGKLVLLILRPIGDILGILLMPLMQVLKPLGLFINALFRPFLKEARRAFRIGTKFFSIGMPQKGMEAMFTGLQLLATPLVKLLVIALGEGLKLSIDVITAPYQILIAALQGLGAVILGIVDPTGKALKAWNEFMGGLNNGIDRLKTDLKSGIDVAMGVVLGGIDLWAEGLVKNVGMLEAELSAASAIVDEMEANQASASEIAAEITKLDKASHQNFMSVLENIVARSNLFGGQFPSPIKSALEEAYQASEEFYNKMHDLFKKPEEVFGGPEGARTYEEYSRRFIQQQINAPETMWGAQGITTGMMTEEEWDSINAALSAYGENLITQTNKFEEGMSSTMTKIQTEANTKIGGERGFKGIVVDAAEAAGVAAEDAATDIYGFAGATSFAGDYSVEQMRRAQEAASAAEAAARAAEASASSSYNGEGGGYQGGISYVPETGRYTLHEGERVVPRHGAAGGRGPIINLGGVTIYALDAREVKMQIDDLVSDMMRKYK